MKFNRADCLLYAVTDRSFTGKKTLEQMVREALASGVTMLQLREKDLDERRFLEEALLMRRLTRYYGVPLIINDSVEIALRCQADGVHVGQDDINAAKARLAIGPDMILGVTAKTVEQAKLAEAQGADYLGSGAVFGSQTKKEALPMTLDTLSAICENVSIPVAAIGGITASNVTKLSGTGIAGAAVVSGIFGQNDISLAVRTLKDKLKEVVNP